MTLMLTVLYPVSKYRVKNKLTFLFWRILEFVEREENLKTLPARQAFSLSLGLIITSLLFDEKIVEIAIISTAIYDGFATIGGKLFGKTKLINNKTLEGSIIGIIANTLALMFIVDFYTALLISIFVSFIELFSTSKNILDDDNFLIPVCVGIFCFILKKLGAF